MHKGVAVRTAAERCLPRRGRFSNSQQAAAVTLPSGLKTVTQEQCTLSQSVCKASKHSAIQVSVTSPELVCKVTATCSASCRMSGDVWRHAVCHAYNHPRQDRQFAQCHTNKETRNVNMLTLEETLTDIFYFLSFVTIKLQGCSRSKHRVKWQATQMQTKKYLSATGSVSCPI